MELEDIVNEEMLTTEDVNDMLEHTDKGRTKQTIRNCVTVLQKDPVLKKAIKRNELSGRMDIVKEVPWERRNNSPTVTDTDENNLKMYLEENYELTSERVIKAGIDIVSNENKIVSNSTESNVNVGTDSSQEAKTGDSEKSVHELLDKDVSKQTQINPIPFIIVLIIVFAVLIFSYYRYKKNE